jgi:NitT/TauT family transport system substrate-binding protein
MSSVGITYLQHYIAQEQGFFQQAGFDAQIQIIPQNALLTGIVAGEISYGDSGGSAVRAAASGLPVRLVSCHGTRPLYMLVLAPGLQAASELNGRAVSINALGSDTHIIGRDLIRKYGGDPDRVEYFPLGASTVRYAAVESGRVAGGIVTVTEAVLARQAGLAVLSTIGDLPLACNAGTVVALAAIGERRAEVQRFLQAIARAVTFMQSQRADTARMLADWVGIDQREAEQTYDGAQMQLSWSNEKGAAQQALETAIAFAKEAGQIPEQVQLTDVADLSFYP